MLPSAVEADARALIEELKTLGFRVVDARYEARSFGNYFIDLSLALFARSASLVTAASISSVQTNVG